MPYGIAEFIKAERIDRACKMLLQTVLPSAAIAEKVGVSDAEYFLRVFKKKMGMSAGTYRKNIKIERMD